MTMKNDLNQFKSASKSVDGWLTDHEAEYLFYLAHDGPGIGVVVEIGSWKGKSTIMLAGGTKVAKRDSLFAIDPHIGGLDQDKYGHTNVNTEIEFRHNIMNAGVGDCVNTLVEKSTDAVRDWHRPVRLLFIDGDHSFDAVKDDFILWTPHVVDGGIIAFHDTFAWDGPKRIIEEFVLPSKQFLPIGIVDSITAVKKISTLSAKDRIRKKVLLLLRQLYLRGRNHTVPGEIRKWSKAALKAMTRVQ